MQALGRLALQESSLGADQIVGGHHRVLGRRAGHSLGPPAARRATRGPGPMRGVSPNRP